MPVCCFASAILMFSLVLKLNINRSNFVCRNRDTFSELIRFNIHRGVNFGSTESISSTKNMIKHLAQGSSEPPLNAGKLRLYGMRFCPYDQRVHLVLIAKKIPHDNVWINLRDKPDWFKEQIPSTKVPGLMVDGHGLYESLIISDFLDEKFAERPLHNKDPLQKAKDRLLIEGFAKVTSAFLKLVKTSEAISENLENLWTELLVYDEELAKRGSKFFSGNKPGMVDYMIWPWFERFRAGKILVGDQFDLPESELKHLVPWMNSMMEDETVKEYFVGPEPHATFIKSFVAGEPVFDIPF